VAKARGLLEADATGLESSGWLGAPLESLPQLRQRPVKYLRDAPLGEVHGAPDLLQGQTIVVVEGGDYTLLFSQGAYRLNYPRAYLRCLDGRLRVCCATAPALAQRARVT
jgi:hypothetical protein